MRRVLWLILVISMSAVVFGQEAESENPPVRVTLTATPAGVVVLPNSATFTATVTPTGPIKPTTNRIFTVAKTRLRYTYKAQRTWPCADPEITLTGVVHDSQNPSLTWRPTKAGEWKITVDVRYLSRPAVTPATIKRGVDGTANLNYAFKPAPGFSHNLRYNVSPAPPTPAPANINASVSVLNPPEFDHWFRYKFTISGGSSCNPRTITKNNQPAYTSWSSVCQQGSYTLFTSVDKVRQSSCEWLQTVDTHSWGDPIGYYYQVTAAQ